MGSPSAARVGVGGRAVWGHKKAITHASGHEAEAEEGCIQSGSVKSFPRAQVARGGGGAGVAAHNTHLQQVVVVLQHAVSLARVSEDPSVLIVVKRGAWGAGGELLKDRRARHRLGGCLPVGRALSTDRRPWVAYSPSVFREAQGSVKRGARTQEVCTRKLHIVTGCRPLQTVALQTSSNFNALHIQAFPLDNSWWFGGWFEAR